MVHPQRQPSGDVGVTGAIDAPEPRRDRLQRREAAPDLAHVPSHALRVPVFDRREDPDLEQLDEKYRALVQRLDAWFGNLERLAVAAFDLERNTTLRLEASVQAAEAIGVPARRILRTTGDLDAFIQE